MTPRADKHQPQSPDLQQPSQQNQTNPVNLIDSAEIVVNHFGVQLENPSQIQQSAPEDEINVDNKQTARKLLVKQANSILGYEMPFDVISAAYAATVAAGGIIGYMKAGSTASLAAGLTFGGILGLGAYMTSV